MSRYLYLLFGMLALCFAPLAVQAAETVASDNTAEAAVQTYISELLDDIKAIQPLFETDKKAYFEGVEAALDEFVDFREVARGVMAKYGTGPNGATAEQLDRFAGIFKTSLVEFYGNALATYEGVVFEIIPPAETSGDTDNANVMMNILDDSGGKFEVQYTMFRNPANVWKLKNLYIEGVNLRRQYYSQFDSMMMSNSYDIDKVIDSWAAAVTE